jgi:hypothetical protein
MGYYTRYKLVIKNIKDKDVNLDAIEARFCAIGMEDVLFNRADQQKWYSWKTDMTHISNMFPKAHFELSGEGEENGDVWVAHFIGGKNVIYTPKVTWPKFKKADLL